VWGGGVVVVVFLVFGWFLLVYCFVCFLCFVFVCCCVGRRNTRARSYTTNNYWFHAVSVVCLTEPADHRSVGRVRGLGAAPE